MAILNFDYNAAMRQAREIESVASEMRTLATRQLNNAVSSVRSGWSGEAANKFVVYCDDLRAQIIMKADSLNVTASTLRRVAAQLEEAEQRAKQEIINRIIGKG